MAFPRRRYGDGVTTPRDIADPRDLLDAETLRSRGSLKWTAAPTEIAAWVAESDFGTAPAVTAAVQDAVAGGLLGYLPPRVRHELASACASWLADSFGWQVPTERVLPVGHVTEALQIAVARYSRPGSAVVLPTPAYMPFVTAPQVWGRSVVQVPMAADAGRQVLDLEALDAAFRAGAGLLILVNPHNPTGRVLDRDELLAVADVVERHGARVFADEIHAPLVLSGRHVPYASVSPAAAGHTITALSASKAWNIPGLKCAQVVLGNDADAAVWAPDDVLLTEGASTLGAVANAAAYTAGREWLADLLGYLDGTRAAVAQALAGSRVGHRPPEGTYLAWLDLRAALDAHAGDADAPPPWRTAAPGALGRWIGRRTGVFLTDGALCGEAGRGFVRLNLAMPRPMAVEAARRIADRLA